MSIAALNIKRKQTRLESIPHRRQNHVSDLMAYLLKMQNTDFEAIARGGRRLAGLGVLPRHPHQFGDLQEPVDGLRVDAELFGGGLLVAEHVTAISEIVLEHAQFEVARVLAPREG